MPTYTPPTAMKCVCGAGMRRLADGFHYCGSCGRAKWDHDGVSAGTIVLIVVVTVVLIGLLGWIGISSEQFRMQ